VLVAMMGWAQAEDQRLTRAAGFDHHFVKPVDHTALQMLLVEDDPAEADVITAVGERVAAREGGFHPGGLMGASGASQSGG
jgi:hypothetical protein